MLKLRLISLLVVALAASAWSQTVMAGTDYLMSSNGSRFLFPAPFNQMVNFMGNPTAIDPTSAGLPPSTFLGATDTIVRRLQDIDLSSGSGVTQLRMLDLALQSVNPVFGFGTSFNVFVSLNPSIPSLGQMTVRANRTFDSDILVNFRALFVDVNNPNIRFTNDFEKRFTATNATWTEHEVPGMPRIVFDYPDLRANVHSNAPANHFDFFVPDFVLHDAGDGRHVVKTTPEPGSLMALGLGLVSLVRRRK